LEYHSRYECLLSRDEETYYPRWLTPTLQEASRTYPVTVLTGARQVGKSTLRHAEPFKLAIPQPR
jgi:predicted AAA+ superfamily ATPase